MNIKSEVNAVNGPRIVKNIKSGNVYAVNSRNYGIFIFPGPGNVKGWNHINGLPRKLNLAHYVDYDLPITLQNSKLCCTNR